MNMKTSEKQTEPKENKIPEYLRKRLKIEAELYPARYKSVIKALNSSKDVEEFWKKLTVLEISFVNDILYELPVLSALEEFFRLFKSKKI